MEIAWILVAVLAIAVAVLLFRKPDNPLAGPLDRLARELERGDDVQGHVEGDPPEVAAVRRALASGWAPLEEGTDEDPGDRAVRGLARYLRGAALEPLRGGLAGRLPLEAAAQEVADALEDLQFYTEPLPDEEPGRHNLVTLVQEAARDYTAETGIGVRLALSSSTMQVDVAPEAFKDALFMLLSNAGRFGGGETVKIEAEAVGEGVRVRVSDRGKGFTSEALERAFEPFWSTDPDALGMGLPYARRVLMARGMRVRIGNREEGGGEGVIIVPSAR
jgi:signal transduction histidine kinase